jgi:hypothetical protein
MRIALLGSIPLLLLACGAPWAQLEDGLTWKVVAPAKVARAADLSFRVEASTKDGKDAREIKYRFVPDWAGVKGSRHTGETFVQQLVRVKGSPGKGVLRIHVYDAIGALHQVAQHEFEIY